jgi:DUF1009 family protein
MAYTHVAHDCRIADHCILANCAALAGHVSLEDHVHVGGLAGVHQFVKLGAHAFVAGGAVVTQDVPPYCTVQGDRAKLVGLNTVGLTRAGYTSDQLARIKAAYRALFRKRLGLREAVAQVRAEYGGHPRSSTSSASSRAASGASPGERAGPHRRQRPLPVRARPRRRRAGRRVVACALRGEADPALEAEVDELFWVGLGELGKLIGAFRARGVTEAAFAGGVGKLGAFRHARPDLKMLRALTRLRHFNDDALLRSIARVIEDEGIRVVPSTQFLADALAAAGVMTRRAPSAEEEKDIALGREVAEAIGRADVGQTVVVKAGHVVAVEAAEGTDACIRRGASWRGGAWWWSSAASRGRTSASTSPPWARGRSRPSPRRAGPRWPSRPARRSCSSPRRS